MQRDMKRIVAYSSVSHMIVIPLLVCTGRRSQAAIMVILYHGISSPILFMLVGVRYNLLGTRQLVLIRGILVSHPLLSLVVSFCFLFNLGAPPFPRPPPKMVTVVVEKLSLLE